MKRRTSVAPVLDGAAPREFFKLDATYLIAPGASIESFLNDCLCLLQSGSDVFEPMVAEELPRQAWAGVYALRQARAVLEAVIELESVRGHRQEECDVRRAGRMPAAEQANPLDPLVDRLFNVCSILGALDAHVTLLDQESQISGDEDGSIANDLQRLCSMSRAEVQAVAESLMALPQQRSD